MINFVKITPSKEVLDKLEEEKAKVNGTYNLPEVVEVLKEEFHDKCYICEQKNVKNINIEHFIPHKKNKDLMFDYNNLYYACGHCNNTKLAQYDSILDPGNPNEDVEAFLHYGMPILHKRENGTITATVPETEKIRNTIELLHYVYNGKTAIKDIEAINIKKDLVEELAAFTAWLREYDDDELEEDEREELKRKIRKGLSPKSAFTAFKRQIVKDIPYLYEDFKEYIPLSK